MEIRVLGPIEAEHEGHLLDLGGPRQRLVLAVLLARVNEAVSTDRIIEDVWLDDPPTSARQTVQAYVSTVRRVLEPCRAETLTARPRGYIAQLDEASLDSLRFEHLVVEGRRFMPTDPAAAAAKLRDAEHLWTGDAYGDLTGSVSLATEVNRLGELRLAAIEARIDAELALGLHGAVVAELEALVDAYPLREGLRGQLMTALYRDGRQAEALRTYQRARHVLGDELGIEPSPNLQHLEHLILMQDPDLAPPIQRETPIVPEVHYASASDGVSIAHYTLGSTGTDLVYIPGWVSNIETIWEHELPARFLLGLASFTRLTCFDKRGTGLSDRVPPADLPDLEQRAADIRTVLDASGIERTALLGISEGGPMAAHFAATHPERTTALVLYGSFATRTPSLDYPWAPSPAARKRWLQFIERTWGGDVDLHTLAPSLQNDEAFRSWWSRYLRSGASPRAAMALGIMNTAIDVRDTIKAIDVPTVVIHRTGDRDVPIEGSRWLAAHIPGAQLIELDGQDHMPIVQPHQILTTIQAFLKSIQTPKTTRP